MDHYDLRMEEIQLQRLNPAVYNPRVITDKEMSGLQTSLDKFGMVEPIVNHQDRPISRLAVWGARRRTRERNQAARRVLLKDWTEIIQDLVPQLSRGYVIRESKSPAQPDPENERTVPATRA